MERPRDRTEREIRRADRNREQRIKAIQKLQRFLDIASAPSFSGSVSVEVHSHEGYLGKVHGHIHDYE